MVIFVPLNQIRYRCIVRVLKRALEDHVVSDGGRFMQFFVGSFWRCAEHALKLNMLTMRMRADIGEHALVMELLRIEAQRNTGTPGPVGRTSESLVFFPTGYYVP